MGFSDLQALAPNTLQMARWHDCRKLQIVDSADWRIYSLEVDWSGLPPATSLAYGKGWVAVGCRLGALFLIDETTSKVERLELGSTIHALAVDLDGQRLGALLGSGQILILNIPTPLGGEVIHTLTDLGEMECLCLQGGMLAAGGLDQLILWGKDRPLRRLSWPPAKSPMKVNAVVFSPQGTYVAAGSRQGVTAIWEVASGKLLASYTGPRAAHALAFSPSQSVLAVSYGDCVQLLRFPWRGDQVETLPGQCCETLAFQSESVLLALGGGTWRWNLGLRASRTRLAGGGRYLNFAFSADGQQIAGASSNIRLWNRQGKVLRDIAISDRQRVELVGYTSKGILQALLVDDQGLWRWRWRGFTGQPEKWLSGHHSTLARFSPDGEWLALIEYRENYLLYVYQAEKLAWSFDLENWGKITDLAFSTTGEVALTTDYGILARWNVSLSEPLVIERLDSKGHNRDAEFHKLAYSSDGAHLLALFHDSHHYDLGGLMTCDAICSVIVWEIQPWRQVRQFGVEGYAFEVCPGRPLIRLGTNLYNYETGTRSVALETREVSGFAFSPQGREMAICAESPATGCFSGTLPTSYRFEYESWLWNVQTDDF